MLAAVLFDYRRVERYAYLLYAAALVMLVLVPLLGSVAAARGAGSISGDLDPALRDDQDRLVMALARYFHRSRATGDVRLRDAIPSISWSRSPRG